MKIVSFLIAFVIFRIVNLFNELEHFLIAKKNKISNCMWNGSGIDAYHARNGERGKC